MIMTNATISRSWPPPAAAVLDDDELVRCYAIDDCSRQSVRLNFVASIDGAATADGLSAGLSGEADKRVFDLLRRLCDVVLIGAGTLRAERYGPMRLDAASIRWRRANGLDDEPVFAIVSGTLRLDPASVVFTEAPVRATVVTIAASSPAKRAALSRVADVVVCGEERLDPALMFAELAKRGLRQVLSEGGPTLFGTLLEAECVDELCLTISPLIEAGIASRIAAGVLPQARRMDLRHVLVSDSTLMLRYLRARANPPAQSPCTEREDAKQSSLVEIVICGFASSDRHCARHRTRYLADHEGVSIVSASVSASGNRAARRPGCALRRERRRAR
jgi:riboflavin biosynthesis pyrimidine reductase